ncbi:MAG: substrate-binding domain-containing protein [Cyanobacteria bacterium P01_E01_bin.34]
MTKRTVLSLGIAAVAAVLAYAPIPGLQQTIVVVSGSELEESLNVLVRRFENSHPNIEVRLHTQGSQDIVNRYIDNSNSFTPTVLIPANGDVLTELSSRWQAIESTEPFYDDPQAIAKTMLVGIAWPERGNILFPDGEFDWQRLETAMSMGSWSRLGGDSSWGSFDFVTTDPTRSNSGQLTLSLFAQSAAGDRPLTLDTLNTSEARDLFQLVRRSVYQPPRSTDILLQEFITRGPNEADVATVYESIALHRWEESSLSQGIPYQIYYPNPTIETVSTAAIVTRDVPNGTARAARTFIQFLSEPEQQAVFVQYGFRPATATLELSDISDSPWSQDIPGVEEEPAIAASQPPSRQIVGDIQRLWERAQ